MALVVASTFPSGYEGLIRPFKLFVYYIKSKYKRKVKIKSMAYMVHFPNTYSELSLMAMKTHCEPTVRLTVNIGP